MDDSYSTIARPSVCEIKVRGSRFIARTGLASSVAVARALLEQIQKKEYAATHNCYAYVIGLPDDRVEFKYSDDGEPNGTAGRPIYDVLCGSGVTNILLVVTRYFGGTKLGTGGLVKAYGEAAAKVMKQSGTKENFITDVLKVELDFPIYDSVKKAVSRNGAREMEADFSDKVSLKIEIRRSLSDQLAAEITEISKGKAKVEKLS